MDFISGVKTLARLVCLLSLVAAWPALAQTFTVSATPQSLTIHPGDQKVPLTVSVGNGTYTGPIVMTLTGLPSGISISPLTLTAGGSGTLYLSATVAADQEDFPAANVPGPTTAVHTVVVEGVGGAVSATSTFKLTVSLTNPAFAPAANQINLPIVTINTNGKAIASKTADIPGTITITSADGEKSYLPNSSDADNTATFHVHGNTTAEMPKLAYNVKLDTSLDLLSTMGLSCPYLTSSGKEVCDKSKSYILLANYDDKSLIRDWSASALANAIPLTSPYLTSPPGSPTPSGTSTLMPWAPRSLFVELFLNGVYEGNYQLIEKVNVDSHRLNITEQTETSADVTGGYLMEIDYHEDEDYYFLTTTKNLPIGMIDPDFTPEVAAQESYISGYVNDAEAALFSTNFASTVPGQGWRKYFDEASAVNFYIVNDVMGNVDGGEFYSSDYFYKNIDNPLIYMGPIWDFDISSGNVNYASIVNPTVSWMQTEAPWYVQWFKDPGFKADVIKQWNTLKNSGVFAAWMASIPKEAATLEQSQANNFGRWPMQGIKVWPNPEAAGSYDGEVQYLTDWLQLRIAYLDSQFNGKAATTTALTVPTGTLRTGTAATLAALVTGTTTPTGTVSFLSDSILLGVGTLDGDGNASLTTTALPAGTDSLKAVYNGDSTNGLSASTAQPVTVLGPLVSSVTSLASSVAAITEDGNADADDTVTFTASVVGNSGATVPSGTVAFAANGSPLGSAPLSNAGVAMLPTTNLPGGSDSVRAVYNGDSTYKESTSNTVGVEVTLPIAATPQFSLASGTYATTQTVTLTDSTNGAIVYYTTDGTLPSAASTMYVGAITVNATETIEAIAVAPHYSNSAVASGAYTIPPTFAMNIAPPSAGVYSGQSATFTLTITPEYGFNQPISFACSNLPVGVACSFSPASITPGAAAATTTLTISDSSVATATQPNGLLRWSGFGGGFALALLLWPVRRRRPLFALILLLVIGLSLSGCDNPQVQVAVVNVTASGGNVGQSQTVVLTITK